MKGGHWLAALGWFGKGSVDTASDELDDDTLLAPAARSAGIDGSLFVMKLPQMVMNAFVKSGPWFGKAGPKNAGTSTPCCAGMTEY